MKVFALMAIFGYAGIAMSAGIVGNGVVSFPVEWNVSYDASVPYEVEIAPKKLGISGDGRYSVLADGKDIGGRSLACGRPVNSACNYYEAMYGEEGGRANWKWDFPIDPESKYYLEQMLVPELAESDGVTVSYAGSSSGRGEEVEVAALLIVPDPDFDLHGDLIKTLCGLNTQRGRVR